MHFRVQRLDPAVHHLGRAGELARRRSPRGRPRPAPSWCRRSRPARRRALGERARERRPARSCRRRRAGRVRCGEVVGHGALCHCERSEAIPLRVHRPSRLLRRACGRARNDRITAAVHGSSPRPRRGVRSPAAACGCSVQCTRPTLRAWPDDHDLDGAARAVLAAQIDAFLELEVVLVRVEVPHVLVGQDQHHAVPVGQARRLDARMQVEAHRELVERVAGQQPVVGRHEQILAVDPLAVGRDLDDAVMHDAEAARIAVMGDVRSMMPSSAGSRA